VNDLYAFRAFVLRFGFSPFVFVLPFLPLFCCVTPCGFCGLVLAYVFDIRRVAYCRGIRFSPFFKYFIHKGIFSPFPRWKLGLPPVVFLQRVFFSSHSYFLPRLAWTPSHRHSSFPVVLPGFEFRHLMFFPASSLALIAALRLPFPLLSE